MARFLSALGVVDAAFGRLPGQGPLELMAQACQQALVHAQLRGEHIDGLLLRLKETINPQLSSFSKIARFVEHEEPFQKTATSKIKRYLYTH